MPDHKREEIAEHSPAPEGAAAAPATDGADARPGDGDADSLPPSPSEPTSTTAPTGEAATMDDETGGAVGDEGAAMPSLESFFSAEKLKSLLEVGGMAGGGATGDGRLEERVARIETLLEEFVAGGRARDQRMEETNRAMRAYFTDELGRLREAITQELRVRAAQKLLQEVLPILNDMDDLLARSDEAARDEQTARLWRALEAYRRRFYNGLRRLGLEEIKVVEGETLFDPYIHECVSTVAEEPSAAGDDAPPVGLIVGVRRRGYLFQNELFQAPQVIIRGGE